MYSIVNRRKYNPDTLQETIERARREFFPKLQAAPGFVGFYLVNDQDNRINTAISVWQDKEHAEAFRPQVTAWTRVLEELGHITESDNRGETTLSLQAQT
jgi:heme-degrading monooxygenase HmoA